MPIMNSFLLFMWLIIMSFQLTFHAALDVNGLRRTEPIPRSQVVNDAITLTFISYHVCILFITTFPRFLHIEFRHGVQGLRFVSLLRFSVFMVGNKNAQRYLLNMHISSKENAFSRQ